MLFTMTPRLSEKLECVLKSAVQRAEAKAIYISDRGGNILAVYTLKAIPQEDNLSALAAGSFFATQELARMIGEGGFECVFHQGTNSSMYMQNLSNDMLMLVVFGTESNPGLIRLYCGQAARTVNGLFAAAEEEGPDPSAQFGAMFEIDDSAQPFTRTSS
jgi:predicted regulator of Ras-like GTPase activity (Roadblock/LC7/MglB family)